MNYLVCWPDIGLQNTLTT